MRNVLRSSLPQEIKDSLSACWKEGVVAQVMISIFDYYLIPYGLLLGASTQQIGLLVAIPNILSSVAQLFAVRAVYWAGNRRRVLVYGVGIQAVLLIPVAILPYFPLWQKIYILIGLMSVYRLLGSVIGPAWGSLVSDYLPEGQRGQYFGWRARMVSIAGMAGIGFWGSLLTLTRQVSENLGFLILFSGAVIFRFLSFYFMSHMIDVPVHASAAKEFTLSMFLKRLKEDNFVKFIFYAAAITFAAQLSAPYGNVFMLRDLKFSYLSYTLVQFAAVVGGMVSFPIWGRHMDEVGSARILKSTSLLIPIVPVFWLFARHPVELIMIEFFSGFIWSGFGLATSNFIYDSVNASQRVRGLAYFNLINGGAIFAGASLGGWLAEKLPPLLGYRIVSLFLISAILRFAADFLLSKKFQEVRVTRKRVSSGELYLSMLGLRTLTGENTEPEPFPSLRPPREKISKLWTKRKRDLS